MLVSLIIVFREALEAGLIVGIVLAATQGIAGRGRWIAGGIAAGAAGAGLVAMFAAALSDALEGLGQEVFTASILLFAVVMLTWHVAWMSSHARVMAAELRDVGHAVRLGHKSLAALAAVVAVAVMREGSEVVLFLFGIAAGSQTSRLSMLSGGLGGLGLAAMMSWLLYRGLLVIPLKWLFAVTNVLIAFLAAGMAATAVGVLQGADLLPTWGAQLWNTSWLLDEGSIVGKTLHALIGYTARPSGIQVAAWIGTLAVLWVLARVVGRPQGFRTPAAAAGLACLIALSSPARADSDQVMQVRRYVRVPSPVAAPADPVFRLPATNSGTTADAAMTSR